MARKEDRRKPPQVTCLHNPSTKQSRVIFLLLVANSLLLILSLLFLMSSATQQDARMAQYLTTTDLKMAKYLSDTDSKVAQYLAATKSSKPTMYLNTEKASDECINTAELEVLSSMSKLSKMSCAAILKFDLNPSFMREVQTGIKDATDKYKLPEDLIYAIIERESSFNPNEESYADCHGLMQVNYDVWAKEFELSTREVLYDPKTNIDLGCRIFKQYYDEISGKQNDISDDERYRQALKRYFGICDRASAYAEGVIRLKKKYKQISNI